MEQGIVLKVVQALLDRGQQPELPFEIVQGFLDRVNGPAEGDLERHRFALK